MLKRARRDSDPSQYPDAIPPSEAHSSTVSQNRSVETPDKYTHLDTEATLAPDALIQCLLPPHAPLSFHAYQDYEVHYQQTHVNRCLECGRNFPTEHILALHLSENHDPFSAARRDAGEKTYACFVEGCDKVCATPQKRRMHLVDKHHFPREYDFFVVDQGLDGRQSMLRGSVQQKRREMRPTAPHDAPASVNGAGSVRKHESFGQSNPKMRGRGEAQIDHDLRASDTSQVLPSKVSFGRKSHGAGLADS